MGQGPGGFSQGFISTLLGDEVSAQRLDYKSVSVCDPAPDFTLPSLDGLPISLSSYRGRRVILFMWASW